MAFTPSINKNLSDDPKLGIVGNPWSSDDFSNRPMVKIRVINSAGNPNAKAKATSVGVWFDCYPNHPDHPDMKSIQLKFNLSSVYMFLEALEDAVNNPDFTMKGMQARGDENPGSQDRGKIVPTGMVWASRTGEGEIIMIIDSYQHQNIGPIPITFAPTYWDELLDRNKEPISKGQASAYRARGYIRMIRDILPPIANDVFNAKENATKKRQQNERQDGGNAKSSYNKGNNGGGGGNYQQRPKDKPTDVFADLQ